MTNLDFIYLNLVNLNYLIIRNAAITILVLSFLILILSYLLITNGLKQNFSKQLSYECGFQPFEDSRHLFDIKYYIIGILFVVFDLEVIVLFPYSTSLSLLGIEGVVIFIFFLILLVFGFLYEILKKALNFV